MVRRMKAIFAWLSLLASLANLFDVASGQPEEPLAMGEMHGSEVGFWRLRIIFLLFLFTFNIKTKILILN